MDGARCEVDMEVMIWSDIVKSSMPDGILATYWQMVSTMWVYFASGAEQDVAPVMHQATPLRITPKRLAPRLRDHRIRRRWNGISSRDGDQEKRKE
jgi:hypothetical protein